MNYELTYWIFFFTFQAQWERRILKSLNSMCSELGLCLAKPRNKGMFLSEGTDVFVMSPNK